MDRHDERIQNVSSDFICSEVERIDGEELWLGLSFIVIMKVYRKMELCMERNG